MAIDAIRIFGDLYGFSNFPGEKEELDAIEQLLKRILLTISSVVTW